LHIVFLQGIVQMFSENLDVIDSLLPQYNCFIVDLWGVIHDGLTLYPEAVRALEKIKLSGGRLVFLSNAPRRKNKVAEKLREFGIGDDFYEDVVSSGEILFHTIGQHISSDGRNYFYIGYNKDMDILEGTSFCRVLDIQQADFILCADLEEGFTNKMSAQLIESLNYAAKASLPFLCANPDIYIVLQSGGMQYCAGYIGQYYEELGGKVEYFGKPYKAGYDACLKVLNINNLERVLAVGDSFHTDMRGAAGYGIDSLLVRSGVHRDVLVYPGGLDQLIAEYNIVPKYNIEYFR
jgi:HAD superfamily hydrolase (TIGR01459 family)